MLEALIPATAEKKAQLDRLRPLSQAAVAQLQKHYDVELTCTSNAIEGNTLTLRETRRSSSTASPSAASRAITSKPSIIMTP